MKYPITKPLKILIPFLICQFLFWAVVPALFIKTIPLDASEGIAWGYEWQWGYYKHPPLAAWLSNLAVIIQGSPGFTLYAFAQICIIVTFITVWKLTKDMMNENYALISVISLSTIYYYSFPTFNFNPNIISFPLAALLVLYIYRTSKKYSIFNWFMIGVFAGLSILAKYEGAFIFLPALIYIIINRYTRKQLFSFGFLTAVIVYFIIISPHLIWLFNNNLEPINYAFGKTDPTATVHSVWDHIHWPIDYIVNIILPAIPIFIILFLFCLKYKKDEDVEKKLETTLFVILVLLGSFVFTFFLTLILGIHVNPYWTMTFFNFITTSLLYFFRPKIDLKLFRAKFVITICFLAIIIPSIVTAFLTEFLPPVINGRTTLIQFPGKRIAKFSEKTWKEHTSKPLKYIGGFGPNYKSYVNSYSPLRPQTYELFNDWQTPWANKSDIEKHGALFIWDATEKHSKKIIKKIYNNFKGKIIVLPDTKIAWLKGSILEQCKNHPKIKEKVIEYSKYLPFLTEKIKPIMIKSIIILPND